MMLESTMVRAVISREMAADTTGVSGALTALRTAEAAVNRIISTMSATISSSIHGLIGSSKITAGSSSSASASLDGTSLL